jgi:hypothetical protein
MLKHKNQISMYIEHHWQTNIKIKIKRRSFPLKGNKISFFLSRCPGSYGKVDPDNPKFGRVTDK